MPPETMAPWDRLPAFNLAVESNFSIQNIPVLIAKGDPMRTLLAFALSGAIGANVSLPLPIPIAFGSIGIPVAFGAQSVTIALPTIAVSTNPNVTSNQGFLISQLNPPFRVDVERWGVAVTQPWYAIGTGPPFVQLTVIAVSMREWPESSTTPNLIQQVDNGDFKNVDAGRTQRTGRAKLYGNRWRQRQAPSPYDIANFDHASLSVFDRPGNS